MTDGIALSLVADCPRSEHERVARQILQEAAQKMRDAGIMVVGTLRGGICGADSESQL